MVVMVQSPHDRNGNHFVPCILRGRNRSALFWDLLLNPLMGSCPVEVHYILLEHPLELLLLKRQQVVQAFLPYTPQEALADGIGSGSMIRYIKNLNGTCCRYTSEAGPEFVIVIPNQVLWCLPIRGRFSQLLCDPQIGRRSRHTHVDHLP